MYPAVTPFFKNWKKKIILRIGIQKSQWKFEKLYTNASVLQFVNKSATSHWDSEKKDIQDEN